MFVSVRPRSLLGLAAAFGVAWLGGLILGEYPFEGFLPVVGGFLLGVTVVGAAAFVEEDRGPSGPGERGTQDPPVWVTVAGAALAVWGIWRAAWIDAGAGGELPSVAWWAMAAAAAGALVRLVPRRRKRAT